jgi:uncharacterized OB-fold protein
MKTASEEPLSPRAYFERSCAAGELVFQRDLDTGRAVFPPRLVAPGSGSDRLAWEVSKGLGAVYATTTVHSRDGGPYNLALIDLDEGFRMMARVEELAPEQVGIGLRVRLRMARSDEAVFPVFVPAATPRPPARP